MPLKNRWCLEVTMATCWHVEYVSFVLKNVYFSSFRFSYNLYYDK